MRTAVAHQRKGVALKLLHHLRDEALSRGYARLYLETGSGAGFEPALTLYKRFGFSECGAFADYTDNGFNTFLTLAIC